MYCVDGDLMYESVVGGGVGGRWSVSIFVLMINKKVGRREGGGWERRQRRRETSRAGLKERK